MFYQEKRSFVFLFNNIVVMGLYSLYVFHRYRDIILNTPNDFRFWGKTVLILVPVSIIACTIIFIIFNIINKIATDEDMPVITDERDRMIELKAIRVSHGIFIFGFFLAMGSQVVGMQPYIMLLTLVASGFIAACGDEITKIYLYRKGF